MNPMYDKILAVATSLFESRGINASGVDLIIAESGIAKATLYKYFPSKNQLIISYLREKSDRFYAWINDRLASQQQDSVEILYTLCDVVEQWISTPDFHGLPFHTASIEFPDPSHPVNHYSQTLSQELQQFLARIAQLAGIQDFQTLAQQLTIIFEGAAMMERLSPGCGAARKAKIAAITLIRNCS